MGQGGGFEAFLPILLIQLIMVAICWKLAVRVAMNKALYVVLMIVPVVGSFTFVYLLVRGMVMVLEKLEALAPQP